MKGVCVAVVSCVLAAKALAGDVVIVKPPGSGDVVVVKPPAKVVVIDPENNRKYTVNVKEPEEKTDLSGAWSGYARFEREGDKKEFSLNVAVRYEGDSIFATVRMEADDGSSRVTEAECSDNGGGLFKVDETYISSSTGWFAGTETRGYSFDYTGQTGKQPDRMVGNGGDFFSYGSYVMVLSRAKR